MPTNYERREAAAELRNYENAYLVVGEYISLKIPCNRLADLIEPEPERTCRMEYREGTDKPFCSNCGEEMDAYTCEWTEPMEYSYPFCYACGAKVQS